MKQKSLLAPVSRRIRVWLATASIYALFATAAISSSIQMSVQTALAQPLQINAESATARGNKPGEPMVLVAGGYCTTPACKTSSYVTDTAELYNPATETFSLTASMDLARTNHTATLLDDGSVLIAGGQGPGFTATAQLYYPKPARFKATGSMVNNRVQFQATLLTDGEVLVTGGLTQTGGPVPLTAAELYDPRNRTFSSTGSMLVPRTQHASTRLSDGTVLVTGGQTFAGTSITDTAELYDPSTKMFNATNGNMTSGRTGQTATRLFDGQVLVAGGDNVVNGIGVSLSTAELYDPISQTFTQTAGTMIDGRDLGVAVRLCDGRVLVAGGLGAANRTVATADLYDPSSGTFTSTTNNMDSPREYFTATLLPNCEVLIVGGVDSYSGLLAGTAELFDPASETLRKPDYSAILTYCDATFSVSQRVSFASLRKAL
jgi:hypothetical protein